MDLAERDREHAGGRQEDDQGGDALPPAAARSDRATRQRLRTSRRDARHYFHVLRAGKRWRGFMAIPSARKKGKKLYVPRAMRVADGLPW